MKKLLILLFSILTSLVSNAQITILVTSVPENTPANDAIHIAGDFQGWNPSNQDYAFTKDSITGYYHLVLYYIEGDVEFKFTRGDWSKVESDENGRFIPNRKHTLIPDDTLKLKIEGWEDLDGNGSGTSTAAENVEILSDSFYIPQLNRYRRVWIYLPPDYSETNYDYPVLYMHDGQNVFDANTSFAGEWKVDETLNELHAKGDSGIIVVAIDNGGSFRTEEYTPWENTRYGGGEGEKYVQFIVEDLKPFIDANYRTLSTQRHTGIMGSSLGGLISTYAALKYPNVFGKVGSFSPAYWINPEIFDFVNESGVSASQKFYQIAGSNESESMVTQMLEMQDSLQKNGIEEDRIKSIEKADGAHSEWFWAREFKDAYLWLFRNTTSSIKPRLSANNSFRLFPNPTSGQFSINLDLYMESDVTLELFDFGGRRIAVLFDSQLPYGANQIDFDASEIGVGKGVYYINLNCNGRSLTQRLVLVE